MAPLAWPVLACLLAGVGTLGLVAGLWDKRTKPGAAWFLVALGGQTVAAFAYAAALLTAEPALRWAFMATFLAAVFVMAGAFPGFALAYTGRGTLAGTWWGRGYLAVTGGFAVLFLTNPVHHLVFRAVEVVPVLGVYGADVAFGPLAAVTLVAGSAVVLTSSLLLFETVLSYGPLYRGEAVSVGLSTVPPVAGMLAWVFGLGPVPELNFMAVLFVPHVALDLYAFVYSDMFEFHPATRRAGERAAIEDLGSPVVIVDERSRVVTGNAAAESDLGLDLAAARTDPLSAHLDGDAVDPTAGDQSISVQTPAGPREFSVVPERLTDDRGTDLGHTLVFQDVTAERRREQRLEVLNRILRHNLRNDLNVVQGFIEAATEESDDAEVRAMLDRAATRSEALAHVGENARAIEEALQSVDHRSTVDVATLVRDVREDLDGVTDDASISVDVPPDLAVETNRQLCLTMLANLVENAVVHHDGETPQVSVSATARDGVAEITVADDGPGIPAHELDVLDAGEETDLDHGSGLGLWLVDWGARSLGGDVTFDVADGTTVTVTLPMDAGTGEADAAA